MGFRVKDFFIDLIPFKSIRHKLRFEHGTYPHNTIMKTVRISHAKNLKLGEYIFIGERGNLFCEGGIEIGSYTRIGLEVLILTSNHSYKSDKLVPFDARDFMQKVSIGKNCWLGSRVTICPGVKIDEGAVVAAGSVVTKSVPKCAIVGGNPAKIIGYRDIETYDRLESEHKNATFNDVKNREWVMLEGHKEYLK